MKCPYCGIPMLILKLPSEGRYGATKRRELHVCEQCGYEKEKIYGDKIR